MKAQTRETVCYTAQACSDDHMPERILDVWKHTKGMPARFEGVICDHSVSNNYEDAIDEWNIRGTLIMSPESDGVHFNKSIIEQLSAQQRAQQRENAKDLRDRKNVSHMCICSHKITQLYLHTNKHTNEQLLIGVTVLRSSATRSI